LYCTLNTGDQAATTRFYADLLGLRPRREPESGRSFLYDWRGPRHAPGIQLVQRPQSGQRPTALGFRVKSLSALPAGYNLRPLPAGTGLWTRDPDGVPVEVIETPLADGAGPELSHLRLTCSDLGRSIEWYQRLGFHVAAKEMSKLLPGDIEIATASLRLDDGADFHLELVQWISPPAGGRTGGLGRVTLAVDDVRMAHRRLGTTRAPDWLPVRGGRWVLSLRDPDGVRLALVESPRRIGPARTPPVTAG
jgi:catechol 2,3-dioxygenase-like lactoylglutathione lyase family enzyme